jgi:hypothetical protein
VGVSFDEHQLLCDDNEQSWLVNVHHCRGGEAIGFQLANGSFGLWENV